MSSTPDAECRRLMAEISAYLDGDLDATACAAIERHCRDCSGCATVIEGLRQTIGLCRQAATMPLPEAVRQRARQRIRRLLDGE